jgi:hypothetical protein
LILYDSTDFPVRHSFFILERQLMTFTISLKTLPIASLLSAGMCISANAAAVVVDGFGDSGWRFLGSRRPHNA